MPSPPGSRGRVLVLSVRASVPVAELASAQGEALRALWRHLQHHGGRPSGPPYVRYHRFGEAETDMEVGIPVAAGTVGQGRVAAGELPGGTVVSAWHLGAHDRLGDAYAAVQAWLKEHTSETLMAKCCIRPGCWCAPWRATGSAQ
jgi:effector-binding domain-containing protein